MLTKDSKILFISNTAHLGGAESSLLDVVSILTGSFQAIVALPGNGRLAQKLQMMAALYFVKLIRFKRNGAFGLAPQLWQLFKGVIRISRIVVSEKVGCIYANTTQAYLYALPVKLITGRPLIWHLRDNLPGARLTWLLSFFADKIICVSDHLLQQLPHKDKAYLVYNGIDTRNWRRPVRSEGGLRTELGLDRKKLIIAHIGQLIPWKRHELFIEVASKILNHNSNVHCVIIGSDLFNDSTSYKALLVKKIKSLDLTNHLTMMNHRENILCKLADVDVLVHLAEQEPFGRILVEAMSLEIPIVAMNSGGPAEVVIEGQSGFLMDNSKPQDIAKKICLLLNSPSLREKFGKEARRLVEDKFNLNSLEKIRDIIFSLND
ncbi:glycosyltransferase family 4 protein [Pedobacter jejuensis]|uniref:Glycosyltransferase family 1 protein n=1 Tax=Pedobacter jejuensis TaxID=1268550 RepID=A0A3N0BW63_9SPHI|nr:glycosyltransferase family 4 protein [Pedobacter jejuensis]RNL53953.1 glycosyltransferase family 1 protein [Pedobacter jejuensis]